MHGNCYPVCEVINFEIHLSFPNNQFSYVTKNSEQILKFLKNEKSFQGEIQKHFSSLLKDFRLPEIAAELKVRLRNEMINMLYAQKLYKTEHTKQLAA